MDQQIVLSPLPLTDLVGAIARAVCSEMDTRPQAATPPPEELLTREEAAQLLGITLPTLRDYTRRGLVEGYRIGTRVRYKRSEVLGSLQRIRTPKPQRA
ncbi:MAG: helix-turn-helix domain-containing protein [Flavobacteriales bacterium]|jgi:excisionase family DNA binding protein|nr:helix-turn-helix domain-containing protein [Flavobacteriales bacterium]MBK7101929.1 helix-turn-helix domain-containing protein [Flavobacteriales bacterium]MBK7483655.1 helix-turn-helix domain-containing protein [Flavobacteriales bacterium]HQW99750.1 helix-turn-helix domain-containing protein [Flavobacteriales bacterium]